MTKQRSSFREAVLTPPFAYAYWGLGVVELAFVVWSWGWGTLEQRAVVGYVVIVSVILQFAAAQLIAARIERRRSGEAGSGSAPRGPGR